MKRIRKSEVQSVALSAGFGFSENLAVRRWMASKGFNTYADYARVYIGTPRDIIAREIENHATA